MKADDEQVNPAIIAHQYELPINSAHWWWNPQDLGESLDVYADNIDLIAGKTDVLARFASYISDAVIFPRSTAYLHALGVISAAMTESFYVTMNGRQKNTVGLFTVGAQPPSSGKSGINEYLCDPIEAAYEKKAKLNRVPRAVVEKKISEKEMEIKKSQSEKQDAVLFEELFKLKDQLKDYPEYVWSLNDPTPEGCEKVVIKNNGFFNVVSDESSTIRVVLGVVYSDRPSNNGIFLHAYDNGQLVVARGSREGFSGRVRGAIAVLAQDEAIEQILKAGLSGEGISERFLMIREKNLLGYRDHTRPAVFDAQLLYEYTALVENIVSAPNEVIFTPSPAAARLIKEIKNEHEPLMADGGLYSAAMLRGVVGKNDKQILKIASVLHCVKNWCEGGKRDKEIQVQEIINATYIFNQLLRTYVSAADSKGFTGEQTELKRLIEYLKTLAGKNKHRINVRTLRDNIKKTKAFMGVENLTGKVKSNYLPKLQKLGYVVFDDVSGEVFINPKLKE